MAIVSKVLDKVEEVGKAKGLWGDSSRWLAAWVLIAGIRWVYRKFTPGPTVVRETLEPGQRLVIEHFAAGDVPPLPGPSRTG